MNTTWEIRCGDCVKLLAELEEASVDSVITDPPYGTASKSKAIKREGELVEFDLAWDMAIPTSWIALAARLLKPGAALVAFTDIKAINVLWAACEEAGLKPLKTLHWIKPNPGPNMRQNFASAVEAAVFARKPGKILHWSGGGFSLNWFSCPVVTSDRIHETQKPVAVMAWPMRIVTPPGGLVLDPFCGSGSAGAAAIQYGFQFLGMELEETYCERARVRLARQHSQEKLFY